MSLNFLQNPFMFYQLEILFITTFTDSHNMARTYLICELEPSPVFYDPGQDLFFKVQILLSQTQSQVKYGQVCYVHPIQNTGKSEFFTVLKQTSNCIYFVRGHSCIEYK